MAPYSSLRPQGPYDTFRASIRYSRLTAAAGSKVEAMRTLLCLRPRAKLHSTGMKICRYLHLQYIYIYIYIYVCTEGGEERERERERASDIVLSLLLCLPTDLHVSLYSVCKYIEHKRERERERQTDKP